VEKNGVSFRTRTGANIYSGYGGRAGWKRTGFFSHTYRSQYVAVMVEGRGGKEQGSFRTRTGASSLLLWWKGGVEKNRVLFAHVPEPIHCRLMEGRGGKEQGFFRTRTGPNLLLFWWKSGVEKNRVLFAHVSEPIDLLL